MDDHAPCRARIRQLEAQARRDTDTINDAEEAARVYRRLAFRFMEENERLRALLALDQEERP